MKGKLRIIPLGGLGEIGLNLMLVEYLPAGQGEATAIAIDCGLMFPEQEMLGIDVVIPDISYLRERQHLKAIVFTHGHEDHIGALPYVLREFKVPIYGTRFTLGLVRDRLREQRLLDEAQLYPFVPRQPWQVGPFSLEGIHVTHSIVDAVALAITTPLGTVIHTGDFKLDHTPIDGKASDLVRLAEYAQKGVLLLLSDSTNVERKGSTPSERAITRSLEDIIAHTRGRVLVATFASHIHRLQQIVDLSCKHGRSVGIVGKRLVANTQVAQETGHLSFPPGVIVDVAEISRFDPERVTLLTTGSQGEPLSALTRIASNDHGQVKLGPGDTVILSARIIPGNERTVARLIDHLHRRGAEVHYETVSPVHVSGHASQEELKLMLNLVRPRYFVPIHGQYRHLVRHCELAIGVGIAAEGVFLLEDGEVLEVDEAGAYKVDRVRAGRVFVDGLGDIEEGVLRDRRHMAEDGVVVVIVGLNLHSGEIVAGPDILSRGFLPTANGTEDFERAKDVVRETVAELPVELRADPGVIKEQVRQALRRYFRHTFGRRPVVLPFVMEM
jgi:ribonuclease J